MSEVEVYKSVLVKLGRLAAKEVAFIDNLLTELLQKEPENDKKGKSSIAQFSGAWEDWDEAEFQSFLEYTKQIRAEMFSERQVDL